MCIFKKRNNKVFIVGDTTKDLWRHKMHNMETRVESPWFFKRYGDERMLDSRFKAVSPRTVVATVGDVEYRHLEKAMMGCATVYVPYPYAEDDDSKRLIRLARWSFKRVIWEEEDDE